MPAYTWTTGETITAVKLQALEDEAWRIANQIAQSDSTSETSTLSTTFIDAAATVTFTPKTTSVYIIAHGGGLGIQASSGQTISGIAAIQINGTDYPVSHVQMQQQNLNGTGFSGVIKVTGLTANTSYTAKLRLRSTDSNRFAYINKSGLSRQTLMVYEIVK